MANINVCSSRIAWRLSFRDVWRRLLEYSIGYVVIVLAAYEVKKYRKLMTVRVLVYLYIFYGIMIYPAYKNGEFDQ